MLKLIGLLVMMAGFMGLERNTPNADKGKVAVSELVIWGGALLALTGFEECPSDTTAVDTFTVTKKSDDEL